MPLPPLWAPLSESAWGWPFRLPNPPSPFQNPGSATIEQRDERLLVHWPLMADCYVWYSEEGLGGLALRTQECCLAINSVM